MTNYTAIEDIVTTMAANDNDADVIGQTVAQLFREVMDSELAAMRAAMFAVNFDFAQRVLQAIDRSKGK